MRRETKKSHARSRWLRARDDLFQDRIRGSHPVFVKQRPVVLRHRFYGADEVTEPVRQPLSRA
jgi:hypothetical protein